MLQRVGAVDSAHEPQGLAEGRGTPPRHDEQGRQAAVLGTQPHEQQLSLEGAAAAFEVWCLEDGASKLSSQQALAQLQKL